MKYTTEIKINVTLDIFIKKMDAVDNLKHWQRGLLSAEHISGDLGQLGAKMKLKYRFGKRQVEITETITKRNFPNEFHANYTMIAMHNIQHNYFEKTSNGFTKWTSHNEYIPLTFKMRIMLFFMPRAFKKQSLIYMQDFKNFAENGTSVTHA
ncbi:SRPBCC family protein [Psychroserpens sp.]|jgi:hypothetical protein|uniref:SRPBCC family protein n=1 Tax=Psychroserpens sp. TaxID=2020870 RepID=UPI0039E62F28